jgi:hypothetical protein
LPAKAKARLKSGKELSVTGGKESEHALKPKSNVPKKKVVNKIRAKA